MNALVAIPFVSILDGGRCLLFSCQVTNCDMVISIVFFTDLSQLPVGGKMVSFIHIIEIVSLNISSKCMTCKYMCIQYPATCARSILWRIKPGNNIFIFMKPCLRSVD